MKMYHSSLDQESATWNDEKYKLVKYASLIDTPCHQNF